MGGFGGAKEGAILWFLSFFCSFALLFLHVILIKCSRNVLVLTVKAHTHSYREALLGGNFFVFDPGNDRGPTATKKLMTRLVLHLAPQHQHFSKIAAIKFKSLENA